MAERSTIYVGNKPVMNYVLAVISAFGEGHGEVTIKARGQAISRAVDTAEITRNRFLPDVKVENIQIDTEELEDDVGNPIDISSIELSLAK